MGTLVILPLTSVVRLALTGWEGPPLEVTFAVQLN